MKILLCFLLCGCAVHTQPYPNHQIVLPEAKRGTPDVWSHYTDGTWKKE